MILIDFNGTISELDKTKRNFFDRTLKYFKDWGFTGSSEDLKRTFKEVDAALKYVPHNLGDYPKEVAKKLGLEVTDDAINQQNQTFERLMVENASPLVGSLDAIKELSEVDELVIFTNEWESIVFPLMKKFKILNYFSDVVCIGGTGMNKDKGHFFPELKQRGAWAIIGDKAHKDGMGEKHGIKFIDVQKGWKAAVKEIINLKKQMQK